MDDNFAWELWQLSSSSPFQKENSDLMTVNISGEEIWVNMKRIRLRRRLPRAKSRPRPMGLRGRKREKAPGEWAQQFEGKGICSYPPEDIVLKITGSFSRRKGRAFSLRKESTVNPSPRPYWMALTSVRHFGTGMKASSMFDSSSESRGKLEPSL